MNRKKTREISMKLLFQMTINKQDSSEVMQYLKDGEYEDIDLSEVDMDYLQRVVRGVEENKDEIDSRIKMYLKQWKIGRISKIDITILRICTYEFFHEDNIPKNVSINEAIELAKKYGEDKSRSFINGILGSMIKDVPNKA